MRRSIRTALALLAASAVLFATLPVPSARAELQIVVASDLNFGTIAPRAHDIRIVYDVNRPESPQCVPEQDCTVYGGTAGLLYFYLYEDKEIALTYPDKTPLQNAQGQVGAHLVQMQNFSDSAAQKDPNETGRKIARIGGTLELDGSFTRQQLSGTIRIMITLI